MKILKYIFSIVLGRNSRLPKPQHAISDDEHARHHIAILEHRLWSHRRRSRTRHRRPTNHAHPCSQHGMAPQNHQRHPSPWSPIHRTMGRHALHPRIKHILLSSCLKNTTSIASPNLCKSIARLLTQSKQRIKKRKSM